MASKIKVGWLQKFTLGASIVLQLAAAASDGKINKDEVLAIVSDAMDQLGIDVVGRL